MCMCPKPYVNGTGPGYRWNNAADPLQSLPTNPPPLPEGPFTDATLLYDLPGRCGGLDCHSHHFRFWIDCNILYLACRHGGGDRAYPLGRHYPKEGKANPILAAVESLPTDDDRFWFAHRLFTSVDDASRLSRQNEHEKWRKATIEKRVRVNRRKKFPTVEILEATP
jgi:hypothetical protein